MPLKLSMFYLRLLAWVYLVLGVLALFRGGFLGSYLSDHISFFSYIIFIGIGFIALYANLIPFQVMRNIGAGDAPSPDILPLLGIAGIIAIVCAILCLIALKKFSVDARWARFLFFLVVLQALIQINNNFIERFAVIIVGAIITILQFVATRTINRSAINVPPQDPSLPISKNV